MNISFDYEYDAKEHKFVTFLSLRELKKNLYKYSYEYILNNKIEELSKEDLIKELLLSFQRQVYLINKEIKRERGIN